VVDIGGELVGAIVLVVVGVIFLVRALSRSE
jgi:cell division septation protein DedD